MVLTLAHSRAHIHRAVLEGVAFGINHNLATFESIGAQVKRIIAVGGGTKSNAWLQIVSDVSGLGQTVPALTIGASYGDAFLAGLVAGSITRKDLEKWVKPGKYISPDDEKFDIYQHFYHAYLELYHQTKDIVHLLYENDLLTRMW